MEICDNSGKLTTILLYLCVKNKELRMQRTSKHSDDKKFGI